MPNHNKKNSNNGGEDLPLKGTNITKRDQDDIYKSLEQIDLEKKHERLKFRLKTASWVVYISLFFILILTLVGFLREIKIPHAQDSTEHLYLLLQTNTLYELLRTAITTLATVTTLALGFIAGSNIESSK